MAKSVNELLENVDWEEVAVQVEKKERGRVEYDLEVELLTNDLKELRLWQDGVDVYGNW